MEASLGAVEGESDASAPKEGVASEATHDLVKPVNSKPLKFGLFKKGGAKKK